MKTSKDYTFQLAGYEGMVYGEITVPKGTNVIPADNLSGNSFWAEEWHGMSDKAQAMLDSIGINIPSNIVN
jgi:hypothetical protein